MNPIPSLVLKNSIEYPDDSDYFSPSEKFPEYPHKHFSKFPNNIYKVIRECLYQSGLDKTKYGSDKWNPLGEIIESGSRVLVLCNFVYHKKKREKKEVYLSKCTHGSIIRTVIDYILLAVGENGSVIFGNAPLQSCDFQIALRETKSSKVLEFYKKFTKFKVESCDLRFFLSKRDKWGRIVSTNYNNSELEVKIDLGKYSLLNNLYYKNYEPKFRVSDYNPTNN